MSDDSETQDPTATSEDASEIILKELRELKDLVRDVQKRQGTMEKAVKNLASQLGAKQFDLAKSSHAVSFLNLIINQCNMLQILFWKIGFYINWLGQFTLLCLILLKQANITKILAKAYIQLGRFSKSNESKTVSV